MGNIWERIHLADVGWGAGERGSLSDTRVSHRESPGWLGEPWEWEGEQQSSPSPESWVPRTGSGRPLRPALLHLLMLWALGRFCVPGSQALWISGLIQEKNSHTAISFFKLLDSSQTTTQIQVSSLEARGVPN